MRESLYQRIEIWRGKPYFEEFQTLVNMAYELEEKYKQNNLFLNPSVIDDVSLSFRCLKISQKDAEENYCPTTSVKETSKEILGKLILRERMLDYRIKNKK